MREAQLRNVLLVKAIEETDGTELLIPEADRKAATREVARDTGDAPSAASADPSAGLPRRVQRMLAARAELLLTPVVARHPFVSRLASVAGGSFVATALLIIISALFGAGLSALDGTRRIDILSLPMLALIFWNLLVYAAIVIGSVRSSRRQRSRPAFLRALPAAWALRRVRRFVAASADYNAALAKALDRFVREWSDLAKPLLLARATRLFHLCGASAGIGLICALYLRGLTVDYSAGWESTFLDAGAVHTLASILYGPAAAITGIAIPDSAGIEMIRWQNGGGERAAYWINLLTASLAIYIVVPRLALAGLTTLSIWRGALTAELPGSLAAYFSATFGAGQASGLHAVTVIPYGYAPADSALGALRTRLVEALGDGARINCLAPVPYGEEDAVLREVARGRDAGGLLLLVNLAATPEEENHGVAIDRLQRGATASRKALVIVDEGPYAARMLSHGGPAERMQQRRRLWTAFVERHGSSACFINFDPEAPHQPSHDGSPAERFRATLLQL